MFFFSVIGAIKMRYDDDDDDQQQEHFTSATKPAVLEPMPFYNKDKLVS